MGYIALIGTMKHSFVTVGYTDIQLTFGQSENMAT